MPDYKPEPSMSQPIILVVEDDPHVLDMVDAMLRREFRVFRAGSVEEAECLMDEGEVETIVCDHFLPGENGIDFLARLRVDHPNITRILMTGSSEADTILAAINEGEVMQYLVKPRLENLRDKVRRGVELYREKKRLDETAARQSATYSSNLERFRGRLHEWKPAGFFRKTFGMGALTLIAFFGLALGLGLITLITLYILKTFLGIDLFPDVHLRDWV